MDGTIAEIRLFAGNFSPRGWFLCQGQLLSIAQYNAFFSLLGTTYGGDGRTTFGLPDLRGRVPVGTGTGPGLPTVQLGEVSGTNSRTLTTVNLPAHNHPITGSLTPQAATDGALNTDPSNRYLGPGSFYAGASDLSGMAPVLANGLLLGNTGAGQPFSLMQPYTGLNYIICSEGVYPSRN